jgi:hypothetical protein
VCALEEVDPLKVIFFMQINCSKPHYLHLEKEEKGGRIFNYLLKTIGLS